MKRFENKTVFITGASSGIGRCTALEFAKEGANLVLFARRADKLNEVRHEICALGAMAIAIPGSVSDFAALQYACGQAVEQFGALDILVNNAGVDDGNYAAVRCTDENWFQNLEINEKAVFLCMKAGLEVMVPQAYGAIINVSSIGGAYAVAGAAYSAAKRAVIGLTKNAALQYAGTGIRCNAVCPGPVPTALLKPPSPETHDMEMLRITGAHIDKTVPFLSPEDISNAILFFADDKSARITGQILIVDGGRCL